ncbi:MAG TPA: hypothetical protein VHD56_00310 [Tepidisphaeraceae bacterium]|nr:hypothetical protein [Tepidisphaeraceae bacterium]
MSIDMSTAEIIAELPRLSSAELALVEAKLRELLGQASVGESAKSTAVHPRIHSPHLADPSQSRDFRKKIVERSPDARL